MPNLNLHARDEKARRGAEIPLRKDLAAELHSWMEETLALAQADARERDEPVPARLTPGAKLLKVPVGLIRIFNRDLAFAGIATLEKRGSKEIVSKTDERGRTVDIHPHHGAAAHLRHAPLPRRRSAADCAGGDASQRPEPDDTRAPERTSTPRPEAARCGGGGGEAVGAEGRRTAANHTGQHASLAVWLSAQPTRFRGRHTDRIGPRYSAEIVHSPV